MKYVVEVDGRSFVVDVTGDEVRLDGTPIHAVLTAVPHAPLRYVLVDGTAHAFAMVRGDDGWTVERNGESWSVSVMDERTARLRAVTGSGARHHGVGAIRAPMPGLVLRVEVEPGQRLPPGAGVVVLEAMKMENEIRAPAGGVVRVVHVEPGQAVEKGAPLVELGEEG